MDRGAVEACSGAALSGEELVADRVVHDADERLEAVSLTVAEALEAVRRGAIVDAKSLVAIGIAGELARTGSTG